MPHTEELLEKWNRKYTNLSEKFIKDGIISISDWNKTEEKVLFLLKEVNLAPGSWSATRPLDIQTDFRKTAEKSPWKEIGQWAYGILNRQKAPEFKDANVKKNWEISCRAIAIVNLKKTGGGNSSNPDIIKRYADEDAEFLREQIELIKPKIIICCGKNLNFNIAKDVFSDELKDNQLLYERFDFIPGRLFKGKQYFWVDYVHPQMRRGTHQIKFNSLLSIVNKIP